jgi:UDP-N-acetylglucosamine acyltransferase
MEKSKSNIINFNRLHPTAIVHPGAKLGKNVVIGPYSVVGEQVEIGDDCEIGPHVTLDGHTTIGSGNRFFKGASIGCNSPNINHKAEKGYLVIGDHNVFRENVIVCCGTEGETTRIGNDNLFIANSFIEYCCQIGNHTVINYCTTLADHVVVEDRAIISGLSEVCSFVRIGEMAMIGYLSKIVKDIPPYMLMDGNPAAPAGINVVGLRRNGIDAGGREQLKKAYRILYRTDLPLHEAIERMKQEFTESEEVGHLIHFLSHTQIGILQ